jgi:hypothetical protein
LVWLEVKLLSLSGTHEISPRRFNGRRVTAARSEAGADRCLIRLAGKLVAHPELAGIFTGRIVRDAITRAAPLTCGSPATGLMLQ